MSRCLRPGARRCADAGRRQRRPVSRRAGSRSASARPWPARWPSRRASWRRPTAITLAQGIAGGDKMDWADREGRVELGVAGVRAALSTSRGVVRLFRRTRRQARGALAGRCVRAACEQCGRNRVPAVAAVSDYAAWAGGACPSPVEGEVRLMLSPRAEHRLRRVARSKRQPARSRLLIGPEGGVRRRPRKMPRAHAASGRSCWGARVLRTETAGMAMLAALAGALGRTGRRRAGTRGCPAHGACRGLRARTAAKSAQSPRICVGMPNVSRIGSSIPARAACRDPSRGQPSRSLPAQLERAADR